MHHNWYAENVRGRMPRVRYGHVHLYNNYYASAGNGYCIGVGYECHIRVENTYFERISGAWADYGGVSNGEIGWNNLIFVYSSQPAFVSNSYPVFEPPYTFSMDSAADVKAVVTANAGNVFNTTFVDESDHNIPSEFKLLHIYPNPFNPTTKIKYNLEKPNHVFIKIYNVRGEEIDTLVNRYHTTGEYEIIWQPTGLPSGLYFCRLHAGKLSETKTIVLLK
jgi:hypothetical protein